MHYSRWGFTSFSKTGIQFVSKEGIVYNQYRGHFSRIPDKKGNTERVRIKFYSQHPVYALNAIVRAANRGKSPYQYHEAVVDRELNIFERSRV